MIGLESYTPTPEQVEQMGKVAIATKNKKIIYKDIGTSYLIYHPKCGSQGTVSKEELGQIKRSHICPFCFHEIDSTTNKSKENGYQFIYLEVGDETFGYYVEYELNIGEKAWVDCDQVYYACGNDSYHRYLGFDGFANHLSLRPELDLWRYSKRYKNHSYYGNTYNSYERLMYPYDYGLYKYTSKRQYLEENGRMITKSNQKKIAIDNLLSKKQMQMMATFNLNSIEEIDKYSTYFNKQCGRWDYNNYLGFFERNNINNKYYLDYLSRNKISFEEYIHYVSNLKKLGFKIDKPKDFADRNVKIAEMVAQKEHQDSVILIEKRYEELPKYTKGSVTISPFKTAAQIIACGKALQNCIGSYVKRYSMSETDLYHLDLDGKETIAIEVKDKTLKQAYGVKNSKCPTDLMKHIKDFCKENKFKLGVYA